MKQFSVAIALFVSTISGTPSNEATNIFLLARQAEVGAQPLLQKMTKPQSSSRTAPRGPDNKTTLYNLYNSDNMMLTFLSEVAPYLSYKNPLNQPPGKFVRLIQLAHEHEGDDFKPIQQFLQKQFAQRYYVQPIAHVCGRPR